MRFFSRFAIVIAAGLLSASCATRITSDRYTRWSEQDRVRRLESEREEKIREEVERRMGKASPAVESDNKVPALKAPAVTPTTEPGASKSVEPEPTPSIPTPSIPTKTTKAAPAAPVVTTPPVKTATASRAVKPIFREMEQEEEAIY